MEGVQFKQFNSITDYHSLISIWASSRVVCAPHLTVANSTSDRSFAVWRDLQCHYPFSADYLLPENSGVRKAFQDMEAACVKTA